MSFGIDPHKVFADDSLGGNPAFWSFLPGGSHGKIVTALAADDAVKTAIKAKFLDAGNAAKRGFVIDHINRATVNCIGQLISGKSLQPEKANFTVYNLLAEGTAAAIDAVIGTPANAKLHDAFAAQNAHNVIDAISRQTGRALFQTCVAQGIVTAANPAGLIGILEGKLKSLIP